MRWAFKFVAGAAVFLAPQVAGAQQTAHEAWFYLMANKPIWCGVTSELEARAAATSDAFASGESAWLRFHGETLDSIVFSTQSEDAYVEDTYTFGPGLRLNSVKRRGHYIEDPFFTVTFVPDAPDKLKLTPQSMITRRQQEKAGHETYFVDWHLYRRFADFPFARFIKMKPSMEVSHLCPAGLVK